MEFTLPNLQYNVVLAPFTTYKIGGPADYFVQVNNQAELISAVIHARHEGMPYFLLGTGANILISDEGFRGLVIYNQAKAVSLHAPSIRTDRHGDPVRHLPGETDESALLLAAESGATIADLIHIAAEDGLSGLEHFAGIPSSVGGAIWQNLHFLSPDRSRTVFIEEVLRSAKVLMPDNSVKEVGVDFFEFGYDDSKLHHEEIVVLEATFKMTPKAKAEILQQAEANLTWRRERQPQLEDFPSCGSVFKKIDGVGAGRLIDQVGLKGYTIGGAQISEKHANFLVNTGNATASNIMTLAKLAQEKVLQETGYQLEMEIGLVGEF